jgi:hypothetical protein
VREENTIVKRALLLSAVLALAASGVAFALAVPQAGSAAPQDACGIPDAPPPTTSITITIITDGLQARLQAPTALGRLQAPTACKTPTPPPFVNPPDGIFLCYSTSQVVPGVWLQDQAAQLLADGYYYPKALAGNVEGGTNLGSFHLVCNASGTPTGMFVNENGEVVGPDHAADNLGYYPQVS